MYKVILGERSQLLSIGFELQTDNQDAANVYQEMAELLGITPKQTLDDTELKHMLQHLRKNENIRRRYGIRYH